MKKWLLSIALIGISAAILLLALKDSGSGTAAPSLAELGQSSAESTPQQAALASMYDEVIQKNAATATQSCQAWQQQLQSLSSGPRSSAVDDGFKKLILAWKAVEATYIAGDLDNEAIDYPRYIDVFHIGNEDIVQQMQKVLRSQANVETSLSKHSYKTINALEAVLYQDQNIDARERAVAQAISSNICSRLAQIQTTYASKRSRFLVAPDEALSMLVNALANQTFSLKDWRIGDVAGLSKRYEGDADPRRSEYHLSGLSISAIRTILATQNQLIGKQSYANFEQVAAHYGAQKPLQESRDLLTDAQQQAARLDRPDFNFDPNDTAPLYQSCDQLQTSYYSSLIHALPVVAKILEADGD